MAFVFLSPSTQEYNSYITGGTEEETMNQIADQIEPYFRASGINFTRNNRELTAADAIAESNRGQYDLHLALHSNATADSSKAGTTRGCEIYYNPESASSRAAAELIQAQMKLIYPIPELVTIVPTTELGEVYKVRAPGVLVEFAYHDNPEDAAWIQNNIELIARHVSIAVCEYFGLPFLEPQTPQTGRVDLRWGYLNIRSGPSTSMPVVAQASDGAELTVWNQYNGWFVVSWEDIFGYARSEYITLTRDP